MRPRLRLISILLLTLIYFFIPNYMIKLIALFGSLSLALTFRFSLKGIRILCCAFGLIVFSSAFVLNPVILVNPLAFLFGNSISGKTIVFLKLITMPLLLIIGASWVYLSFKIKTRSIIGFRESDNLKKIVLLIAFITAIYYPSLSQELTYAGDESYHALSIYMSQLMLYNILGNSVFVIIGLVLVGSTIFLFKVERHFEKALVAYLSLGFLFFLSLPLFYSDSILSQPFIRGRISRFPAAQPWISAIIGSFSFSSLNDHLILSMETMRFLPLLSLFLLGFCLLSDHRWKKSSLLVSILSVISILTIPDLFYHGTLVYLELPAVFLICVFLFDSKKCISTPYPKVCARWSWWAIILLGFTKETTFPILLLAAACRFFSQAFQIEKFDLGGIFKFTRDEIRAQFCLLAPATLYMLIRLPGNSRPYGANFLNLLDISLWGRLLYSFTYQFGIVIPVALFGIYALYKKNRYTSLAVSAIIFLGTSAFFLCDQKAFIGLARFNILILPSIIFWAWEGLTSLSKNHPKLIVPNLAIFLCANIILSPVDIRGERRQWGQSDERWYPYKECFKLIETLKPDAKVLLGNMTCAYGVSILENRANWNLKCQQTDYISGNLNAELNKTLEVAAMDNYDFLIFRLEGKPIDKLKLNSNTKFIPIKLLESKSGMLLILRKQYDASSKSK